MNLSWIKKYSFSRLLAAKIFIGVLILFSFFLNCRLLMDPDLGWHIRTGQSMMRDLSVPRYDEFSFTLPGHPWVDHEWLVDGFLALAYGHGLWWAITGLFSLLYFIPFYFWLAKAKRIVEIVPVLLAAVIMAQFVAVRPQMLSFLLFFAVFSLILKLEKEKRSLFWDRYKFIFPIIFLLWSNLHAGFFSGIILIFLYVIFKFIRSKITKDAYREFIPDSFILFLCFLATLINPYGLKIYQEIFSASINPLTQTYIQEWAPLFVSFRETILVFDFFIALYLISVLAYYKKIDRFALLISFLFLLVGIKSSRLIQFFVISALPVIFSGSALFAGTFRSQVMFKKMELKLVGLFVFFILLFIFSLVLLIPHRTSAYPAQAVAFLKNNLKEPANVRIFNDYGWGGYLELELPQIKPFIDGRMPHWKEEGNCPMGDYVEVIYKGNWEEVFSRRKINMVLLAKIPPEGTSRAERLFNSFFLNVRGEKNKTGELTEALKKKGWSVSYEDSASILLSKEN